MHWLTVRLKRSRTARHFHLFRRLAGGNESEVRTALTYIEAAARKKPEEATLLLSIAYIALGEQKIHGQLIQKVLDTFCASDHPEAAYLRIAIGWVEPRKRK
jgi:hypothetical protein